MKLDFELKFNLLQKNVHFLTIGHFLPMKLLFFFVEGGEDPFKQRREK
jgi:hypothetical protein